MTDEQINAAIAEACGWTDIVHHPDFGLMGRDPSTHGLRTCVPYYASDLNAMHEAENTLYTGLNHQRYWQGGRVRFRTILSEITADPISATARQRAEAFLKTIEKWEETE